MEKEKNAAAVELGKRRAESKEAPTMQEIGALGGARRAKPTACERCGKVQPTARAAWMHCRTPRGEKAPILGEQPRGKKAGKAKKR